MDYKILFFSIFFFCSCEFSGKTSFIIFDDLPKEILVIKSLDKEENQKNTKIKCKQEGKTCSEFESCKSFCDDLFFYYKGRENCYNWSYSFFEEFKKTAHQLETLSFSNLNTLSLKCFFEMAQDHRITMFKNFTKKSSELFLTEVASNKELASAIYKADRDEFYILKDLFNKINKNTLRALREKIYFYDHFLIVSQKNNNQSAWIWVDDFINFDCKKNSSCQSPLESYCKVLEGTSREDLAGILDSRSFESAYKREIELATCDSSYCKYEKISDFKDFCEKI